MIALVNNLDDLNDFIYDIIVKGEVVKISHGDYIQEVKIISQSQHSLYLKSETDDYHFLDKKKGMTFEYENIKLYF
jgi:hypothetical protein